MLTNPQQNLGGVKTFAVYWEFHIYFCFLLHVKTTVTLGDFPTCERSNLSRTLCNLVYKSTGKHNVLVCTPNDRQKLQETNKMYKSIKMQCHIGAISRIRY